MLRLYIAGNSSSSRRAEQKVMHLRKYMNAGAWQLEIIDVLVRPELAERAGILATPTLTYESPNVPLSRPRRVVGDLSDTRRILEFLGIESEGDP